MDTILYIKSKYNISDLLTYTSKRCSLPGSPVVRRDELAKIISLETGLPITKKCINQLCLFFNWKYSKLQICPKISTGNLYLNFYTYLPKEFPEPLPIYFLAYVLDNPHLIDKAYKRYRESHLLGRQAAYQYLNFSISNLP